VTGILNYSLPRQEKLCAAVVVTQGSKLELNTYQKMVASNP